MMATKRCTIQALEASQRLRLDTVPTHHRQKDEAIAIECLRALGGCVSSRRARTSLRPPIHRSTLAHRQDGKPAHSVGFRIDLARADDEPAERPRDRKVFER